MHQQGPNDEDDDDITEDEDVSAVLASSDAQVVLHNVTKHFHIGDLPQQHDAYINWLEFLHFFHISRAKAAMPLCIISIFGV